MFSFRILKRARKSKARAGVISTPHGIIHTPAFVPVATLGAVKTLTPHELKTLGTDIVLANTYHLYLRPGERQIRSLGGLHKFMAWDGPLMSDSGGFQVFSLGKGIEDGVGKIISFFPDEYPKKTKTNVKQIPNREKGFVKIREEGVEFTSHLDGSRHFFTPEKSIEIQQALGVDIMFTFDECTSPLADYAYMKTAMERTHRWAERCASARKPQSPATRLPQALFGIVQGGPHLDLREQSAKFISSLPFDGFGVGGALGNTKRAMWKTVKASADFLPEHKPRHLLGIGAPNDFEEAIKCGMDLFDCVAPTRLARHGVVYAKKGTLNLRNARYKSDSAALVPDCACYTCANFSRAYVSHLIRIGEILGHRLATIHNVHYVIDVVKNIRKKILA